ncbi:conserved Plasmodium protein, unknown function [Plasmodium ovale]|uniref:Uncharacterized protein n=1 Tax=Plasmodium ovale TaxID=36330 RepID=A0A1C3KM74_PLAOA|nr:conserved Plasmodium protein, unknown function [Plasmodium ovale]
MNRLSGSSYPLVNEDVGIIKSALGACTNKSTWFFTDPRFLQGIFAGILMFYVVLYYTRRYKNKVNLEGNDSFSYVTLPPQMPQYGEMPSEEHMPR